MNKPNENFSSFDPFFVTRAWLSFYTDLMVKSGMLTLAINSPVAVLLRKAQEDGRL